MSKTSLKSLHTAIPCRITNITNHPFYHLLQMFISLWLSVKTSMFLNCVYILPQFTNDSWQLISLFTNLFSYTHSPYILRYVAIILEIFFLGVTLLLNISLSLCTKTMLEMMVLYNCKRKIPEFCSSNTYGTILSTAKQKMP